MPTEDAYSSGHMVLSIFGFADVLLLRPLTLNHTLHHQFMTLSQIWLLTKFDITEYRFPWGICNGCGMPSGDAYSSGHLVLSHFGTCMCSNVETNLFWTCLVSGPLNFEHPSVLLFCFAVLKLIEIVIFWVYYTIPFGLNFFRHFRALFFNFFNYFLWLRITDEGSIPEMRIWSIL